MNIDNIPAEHRDVYLARKKHDDTLIDAFAAEMKRRMDAGRVEYGDAYKTMPLERLLHGSVNNAVKGQVIDAANYCFMAWTLCHDKLPELDADDTNL